MSSYANFYVGNLILDSSQSHFDDELMSLFEKGDKFSQSVHAQDTDQRVRKHYHSDDQVDSDLEAIYFRTELRYVKQLLELQGYTLEYCKSNFLKNIKYLKKAYLTSSIVPGRFSEYSIEELELLDNFNVDDWLNAIRKLNQGEYPGSDASPQEIPSEYPEIVKFIYRNKGDGQYGYPGWNLWVLLRLIVEALDENDTCMYDLTEIVSAGYINADTDFHEGASSPYVSPISIRSRIIVLTEGKSDSRILAKGMEIMFPRIKPYYSFLNFEESGKEGGVGNLVNTVKAFVGSGIENRVIALFDNDSAARDAIRGLETIKLPANIAIVCLPDIQLLENYPTIGPSGYANLNVNRMAGSLELYLGTDVLKDSQGNLLCIQWKGYLPSLERYQGEVIGKNEIQKAWSSKAEDGAKHYEQHPELWEDLGAVYQHIFKAFSSIDVANIDDNKEIVFDPYF